LQNPVCASEWLILSGILRIQKDELVRTLQRNHYDIISMKRRGKWTAFLTGRTDTPCHPTTRRRIFAALVDRRYSKN
jgi:Ribosomal protein L11 methyltransferase (PrmA)